MAHIHTLSVISQYEQASGACLNRDKSVLISRGKWNTTLGVETSSSPQAYLEWLMNSQGKLQIPPSILLECVQSLMRWHRPLLISPSDPPQELYDLVPLPSHIHKYSGDPTWDLHQSWSLVPCNFEAQVQPQHSSHPFDLQIPGHESNNMPWPSSHQTGGGL